jgi:hypothetical protein
MFFVMHCGGIPFNGDTAKLQSLGGSESAALYLAKALVIAGHQVTLFTNSTDSGLFDGVRYEFAGDMSDKYPLGDRFTFYAENTPQVRQQDEPVVAARLGVVQEQAAGM